MEKAIYKYSDFFEDDGGFEAIKRDFDKLGDDLVKRAKEIREKTNLFDTDQVDMIKDVEKQTEALTSSFKKYEKAKTDLEKVERAVTAAQNRQVQSQDDQVRNLIELDKMLRGYRKELSDTNKSLKKGAKNEDELNLVRVEAQLNIKNISKEIREQQKEILTSNDLSKKEQKILEAKLVLDREQVKTLQDVRDRMAALRVVVQSLDFEEESDKVAAYNQEINQLTQVLSDNSDKFIQSKINIGNYEESIVNALKGASLFSGELAFLNGILDNLTEQFVKVVVGANATEKATKSETVEITKNTAAVLANTAATEANTKANNKNILSLKKLKNTFKGFSGVLKASGILLIIAAIGSIGALFSQGRAGAIRTQQVMARFNAIAKVTINSFASLGEGLLTIVDAIKTSFQNAGASFEAVFLRLKLEYLEFTDVLGSNSTEIDSIKNKLRELNEIINGEEGSVAKLIKGWDQLGNAASKFSNAYTNAINSIDSADDGIIEAFKISDQIKRAELNIVDLRKEVRLLEIDAEDSTRSLRFQLESTDKLLEKRLELLAEESEIGFLNLKLANAKARSDAEAAGFNLSENEVQFAKELLALNERLAVTDNQLDDGLLAESQRALTEYLTTLDEVEIAEAEIGKQRREISRDLFEQNLDLLIDLIDTEKNISEAIVNNVAVAFRRRIDEFNRFVLVFRRNSQLVLNEFTEEASNLGLDLDFDIQFNEDGTFDVLVNDSELAIDNIVLLNEQLQNTGLNEIDINRFREFIIETRNGLRDFKELNKELQLVGINVGQLTSNISVSEDELKALENLEERIAKIAASSRGNLSVSERNELIKELEDLENQKTAIEEFAEFQRLNNRKDAIDEELKLVEEESERYLELIQERLDIEKELTEKSADDILNSTKKKNEERIEEQKKFAEGVRQVLDSILDRALEIQQERVQGAEERVERQNELVDIQRERAQEGLSNTLAFEQRELGRREAERIKQEQRQERLEKIRALYSSYNNYASRGDENPLVKALRDFALLESITASFGDGGIVEDRMAEKNNGIIRGRSHQGRQGGIPILVEGKEGILSSREMGNLGKENFYKMKDLASMGKVDSNFFSKQGKSFIQQVPVGTGNSTELVKEMQEVKRAIQGKPVQNWDALSIVNGTLELVETIHTKNKIKRNHYKVKRKGL